MIGGCNTRTDCDRIGMPRSTRREHDAPQSALCYDFVARPVGRVDLGNHTMARRALSFWRPKWRRD